MKSGRGRGVKQLTDFPARRVCLEFDHKNQRTCGFQGGMEEWVGALNSEQTEIVPEAI